MTPPTAVLTMPSTVSTPRPTRQDVPPTVRSDSGLDSALPDLGAPAPGTPEALQRAVDIVLGPVPPDQLATPFAVYVLPSAHPGAEMARQLERDVFLEFFGNTAEMLADEYRDYEDSSVFLCVIDHRRRVPAGMIRVITPSAAGFKSVHDIEQVWKHPLDRVLPADGFTPASTDVWDIATLAVDKSYRGAATGGLVSLALYQAVTMLATRNDIRYLVAVLDLVVLDLINTVTTRPFRPYDGVEPMLYLDSPASLPVYCDFDEYVPRLAMLNPDMHRLLFQGVGLEREVSIPAWDARPADSGLVAAV